MKLESESLFVIAVLEIGEVSAAAVGILLILNFVFTVAGFPSFISKPVIYIRSSISCSPPGKTVDPIALPIPNTFVLT